MSTIVLDNVVKQKTDTAYNKPRQSNFELLRIICMFLIILHHYVVHSDLLSSSSEFNMFVNDFLIIGGKFAVNCFVLISAYFLIDSTFKFKKLLKLILQILFYSLAFLIIFVVLGYVNISNISILRFIFPTTFSLYWFASTYVGLYILSPFLNKIIKAIDKKTFTRLLIVLTVLFCTFSVILNTSTFISNFAWFIYLYFLGAYIKFYFNTKCSNKVFLYASILSYLALYILSVFFRVLGNEIPFFKDYQGNILSMNSLFVLFASVCTFMFFKNLNIKNNKFINTVASTTFGIYLIHDHPFVRIYLWHMLFKISLYSHGPVFRFILYSFGVAFITFVVCSLIELLRIYLIEKPLFKIKLFDKYFKKIDNWMNV